MGRSDRASDRRKEAVLLMESYTVDGETLLSSLRQAGWKCEAVVVEDDGFLPEGIRSCYGHFLGDLSGGEGTSDWLGQRMEGRPRYFNKINAPQFWQVIGRGNGGQIEDMGKERGRIFYAEPQHKRCVRVVDWLDPAGVVRSSDHYNRFGAVFSRTVFNRRGEKVNRTFFDAQGREVIVENFVTGDVLLREGNVQRVFRDRADFVLYALACMGLGESRLFFNSLSTPFFAALRMKRSNRGDLLFWQEPVRDEIPGNMQLILRDKTPRPTKIVVQKKAAYQRLLELGADPSHLMRLGYCYPFVRGNGHRPEALICTNSDRVEGLGELADALPEVRFHVAALTEMSSRLLGFGNRENVLLYPAARPARICGLFERCDIYLDINRENEILSAVRRAFLSDLLIGAFAETSHAADYAAPEHIFMADDPARMAQ